MSNCGGFWGENGKGHHELMCVVRDLCDLLVSHYITALSVNMRPILRRTALFGGFLHLLVGGLMG